MATDLMLTRCCWSGSVGNLATGQHGLDGGLRSGQENSGIPLMPDELMNEFRRHRRSCDLRYFEPSRATALVSASSRIIDTLRRAFSIYYERRDFAANIYIVFVRVPADKRDTVHSARQVAKRCNRADSDLFTYEFLFEYAIPREFVVHSVTVDTLVNRGLDLKQYWTFCEMEGIQPSTETLTEALAFTYFDVADERQIGQQLGIFAKYFGARAPYGWIGPQMLGEVERDLGRSWYWGEEEHDFDAIYSGFTEAMDEVDRMEEVICDAQMDLHQRRLQGCCDIATYRIETELLERKWRNFIAQAN